MFITIMGAINDRKLGTINNNCIDISWGWLYVSYN